MNRAGFLTVEAGICTGTPHPMLDYYNREGLVTASINAGEGRGQRRRYSFADIIALVVIRITRASGLDFKYLRPALSMIQNTPGIENIAPNTLLLIPAAGAPVLTTSLLPAEMHLAGVVVTVPIGALVRTMRQRIETVCEQAEHQSQGLVDGSRQT